MESILKMDQDYREEQPGISESSRPTWHRPRMTKIGVEETMGGTGTVFDGVSLS
ncbi:MAG: hypothetical protein HY816_05620 [Candidatus Wallbacteria bacterium]|nr:hypothetical protein [Candidatus Wallbacteria bacterium]